jgi:predicted transcriptional regulator
MGTDTTQQLTSVKVNTQLFDDFKVMCVRTKLSLQKLTDRAMYLYVTDDDFRKMINNTVNTYYTGSHS